MPADEVVAACNELLKVVYQQHLNNEKRKVLHMELKVGKQLMSKA